MKQLACWASNWESFHVFTDWGGTRTYVDDEERGFAKLWTNQAKRCVVIDVPTAVREQLHQFLPPNDQKPKRLETSQESIVEQISIDATTERAETAFVEKNQSFQEQFKQVWSMIQSGAAIPNRGDRVGEATCAITPYPHQISAFQRLYAQIICHKLQQLRQQGYQQVIVFTQSTDTMDFLRQYLVEQHYKVICFSGRGGELAVGNGNWRIISRDETKQIFREGLADILLCTDAAAEGLNFQFCGALINYDLPWNPMRVEQRIGRIDRLGQVNEEPGSPLFPDECQ